MSVLDGMTGIKHLDKERKETFEHYYADSLKRRILPAIADFTLLALLVNACVNIAIQYRMAGAWGDVHPLAWLYLSTIVLLGIAHRHQALRYKAPLTVYLIYALTASFAYRDFVIEHGWLEPVYGQIFLLAFVGYLCISISHALLILCVSLALLLSAHSLVYDGAMLNGKLAALLGERYVLACLFSAIASIFFVRWLFRNLLATQFLLQEKKTQLEQTFRQLEATESRLVQQQKHHALNLMAKGLLHEVVNPVNNATQALGFAKSVNQDDDVAEAVDESLAQLKRISTILYDLRNFARNRDELDQSHAEVAELVSKAVSFCKKELGDAGIAVKLEIPDRVQITCHPSSIVQVLVNLFMNSAAAFPEGLKRDERTLLITCNEEDEQIRIRVRDNGKGISEQDLTQVSDPFFTLGSQHEHMGLGLSISQTIMRHHNADMTIQSCEGEWTEITLSFPLKEIIDQSTPATASIEQIDPIKHP